MKQLAHAVQLPKISIQNHVDFQYYSFYLFMSVVLANFVSINNTRLNVREKI